MGSVLENAAQQSGSSRKEGALLVPDISESRTEDWSPGECVRELSVPGSIPEVLAQPATQDLTHPTSDIPPSGIWIGRK